ncbi:Dihydroorotate dehydrogenase B (NAD(+)) catalytic subunit [termite gut metagenome]|jgi:dihydroorotate dehydrogenase (NAD+) catalytic subunit|uniref:Dihydroorotate dehydrogenase B (NAD(+)) catalytic subunit n=1 Tax=termite gut metagenome TaxID=433724 RepID=A0A5J4S3J4_9ZZZZ
MEKIKRDDYLITIILCRVLKMAEANLKVNIGKLQLKNPVMTASGTFGYGEEFADFMDISQIGGIIVKGTTLHAREGNPYPRMAETPSGMLNAVGLQNKGIDYFVNHIYPRIKSIKTNILVNVSGSIIDDYVKTAEIINELDKIPAIELNISCPNVKQGGMVFGITTKGAAEVVKAVRMVYKKTLIVKLSPNVTDITEIAKVVEENGADSVSLINTILGMAIDVEHRFPVLSTITGGLSGAAVKPIALRMVWQVSKAVKIPVIGLGGIINWKDAVEFLLAGASAIQIGTTNFIDPTITLKVVDGINDYLVRHKYSSVTELIGALEVCK